MAFLFSWSLPCENSTSKRSRFSHVRVAILLLSTLAATFAISNAIALNSTIICMEAETTGLGNMSLMNASDASLWNDSVGGSFRTERSRRAAYLVNWSKNQKNAALSSFAWGACLAILPISWLMQRYGCRTTFGPVLIIASLATICLPLVALTGNDYFGVFILLRILQGLGYSASLPMIALMTSKWAPTKEFARFMALGTCCVQFSPMLTMPIGGASCNGFYGWPVAFYSIGTTSLVITILWCLIYTDRPSTHAYVSPTEVQTIMEGKELLKHTTDLPERKIITKHIPYKAILTSPAVWAIMVATFGNMCGLQLIILFMPTYLKQVCNFNVLNSGMLSAVPNAALAGSKWISGFISDKTQCCWRCHGNETFKVRLFNSIAFLGMAFFYLMLTIIDTSHQQYLTLGLFTASTILLSFNVGSFFKCVNLVAQQFSGLVMGALWLTTCAVTLILPYIVSAVTPNRSREEWNHLFYMIAACLVLTNVFFCCFGQGRAAKWTKPDPQKSPNQQDGNNSVYASNSSITMTVL